MVTRSIENYEQHKLEVHSYFLSKFGKNKADQFINYYSQTYNPFGRSFLYYKIAWLLYDDLQQIKQSGLRWFGFVGVGGTGKTTLAINCLRFLDPTFNINRIVWTSRGLVQLMDSFPKVNAMKAILLDEPDESINIYTPRGKKLRSLLGKARQQQIIIGYCATDLQDIPPYIFKKLSGIFFTPHLGAAMFYKDRSTKKSYPLATIKKDYYKEGYKLFFKLQKTIGCITFKTTKETQFTEAEKIQYLDHKESDYESTIKSFLGTYKKEKKEDLLSERDRRIIRLKEKDSKKWTDQALAELFEMSRTRISDIIRTYKRSNPKPDQPESPTKKEEDNT